jgi:hypothetical protein
MPKHPTHTPSLSSQLLHMLLLLSMLVIPIHYGFHPIKFKFQAINEGAYIIILLTHLA